MSVAIGKPKTGGKIKNHKIEDGDNVYRILPPMKSLAEAGKWRMYYPVQWGFKNSKGQNRPFIDPRQVNYKTKMVDVESASFLLREKLKQRYDAMVANLKAGNGSQEDVKKALEVLKQYNLDSKHYVNAVNLNGEIGLLKLNTKLKNALEAQMKKYKEETNNDPLYMGADGMTGLYFNFQRSNETGKLQDWVFQVNPYLEKSADGSMRYKTHTMDQGFLDRLEAEACDLSSLYPTPTAEQVASMVDLERLTINTSAVDAVLGFSERTENSENTTTQTASAPAQASASVQTQAPAQAQSAPAQAQSAPAQAQSAPAQAQSAPVQAPASSESAPASSESKALSDEEFLASIGAG